MPERAIRLARFGAAAVIELMQTVAETSDRDCRKVVAPNEGAKTGCAVYEQKGVSRSRWISLPRCDAELGSVTVCRCRSKSIVLRSYPSDIHRPEAVAGHANNSSRKTATKPGKNSAVISGVSFTFCASASSSSTTGYISGGVE